MTDRPAAKDHYPALDGLRGIACVLVIVYHLFPFIHKYLFFGWLAMDIFFVLSGFLITDILLKTFGKKNYLRNFYARRLLRVFPLYYLALVLFLVILPLLKDLPVAIDYFVDNQVYFWFFLQNWLMIFKPSNQSLLNHLWSMAVEEQFYLLWPIAVVAIREPKVLLGILIVLLVGFSSLRFFLWIKQVQSLSYFSFFTFTRFDGILIGCMVALMQKIDRTFIGRHIAVIVLAFAGFNFLFYFGNLLYEDSFPYLGLVGFSTFSMLFGLLTYDIVNKRSRFFTLVFDIPFLRFLGQISYGTYVFHWPLYVLLNPGLSNWLRGYTNELQANALSSTALFLLSYGVGYVSFRFYETPFLNMKKYFATASHS